MNKYTAFLTLVMCAGRIQKSSGIRSEDDRPRHTRYKKLVITITGIIIFFIIISITIMIIIIIMVVALVLISITVWKSTEVSFNAEQSHLHVSVVNSGGCDGLVHDASMHIHGPSWTTRCSA